MRRYTVTLVPETDDDGSVYYTATVPALPEVVTWGDSVGHALQMAQEAIQLVLDSRDERGEEIPNDIAEPPSDVDPRLAGTLYFADPATVAVAR
jgi:antitoxin HicB